MDDESSGSPLFTFIEALAVSGVVLGFAYVLTIFLTFLPSSLMPSGFHSGLLLLFQAGFGIWDKSFPFVLMTFIGFDVALAFIHPDRIKAFINFVLIFVFGSIYTLVRGIVISSLSTLQFSQILPVTYATLTNNYFAIFIFVMLAVTIIFNLRKPNINNVSQTHDYSAMDWNEVTQ